MNQTIRVAIFASGGGSNAQKIIEHFADNHTNIRIALVVCNKPGAGVLTIAQQAGIPTMMIERSRFFGHESYVPELQTAKIDFIVLAGFLLKIPDVLIKAWPQKIVNIHPALLPKYGGKGMYGHFVHEAVLAAGDKESGITIHYVDELYDHGQHLLQAKCPVLPNDTPETLAKRVLQLEHQHFAKTIEQTIHKTFH
jgi:phosphoribosylglycinamide formyltransferase 1